MRDAAGERLVLRHTVSVGKTQGILGQVGRGSHLAQIDFVLRPMTERRETISDVSALMRARLSDEPDVLTSVLVPTIVGGAAQSIQVKLMGEDLSVLDKACLAVAQDLKTSDIATDVENNVRAGPSLTSNM